MTDPCKELATRMSAVQKRRHGVRQTVAEALDDAVGLVRYAQAPQFAACSARLCAYDQLISVYEMIDRVGYASEIAKTSSTLRDEVTSADTCHACLTSSMVGALTDQGKLDEAVDLAAKTIEELDLHWLMQAYYATILIDKQLWIALARRDGVEAQRLLARLEGFEQESAIWNAQYDNATVRSVSGNIAELVREKRVLAALAAEDVEEAVAHYAAGLAHDDPSGGRLEVQVALIQQLTTAQAKRLAPLVTETLEYARLRGYARASVQIALATLERDLGPSDQATAVLREMSASLRSTDLAERVQAWI
ncbi:MAG: hypothetical protein ACI9MR_004791 [Myxococcota bacterium]|jgi:hypothetical protein